MKQAEWIWKENENAADTWLCFVRDIDPDRKPGKVTARIAVDSKYWLYINGKLAVFEGGLKRALPLGYTYEDEIDLTAYFREGKNRIAVLVWYFGRSGFTHLSAGTGGFRFEAAIDDTALVSDSMWKVRKHPAHVAAPAGDSMPNFRFSESDIRYDARLDIGNWTTPGYAVDTWENADILSPEQQKELGEPVTRGIPLFADLGIRDFLNSDIVRGITTEKDTTLEMRLPYNLQFTPILSLDAPAGKQITLRTENFHTCARGDRNLKSDYITREGPQQYESLGWLNGESLLIDLPAGVTILHLQYRETAYPTKRAGAFLCNDDFLNRLWEKCFRTLHITMRDSFMDCPDRERTQWWGDVNIEMQMLLYCMDSRANQLYEKGVDTLVRWYRKNGTMLTVVPPGRDCFELPFQNLAGIAGFTRYYEHTGNTDLIRKVWLMTKDYVLRYETGEDGLVIHRPGSWDWPDWGKHADIVIMENALVCLALESCARMAVILGEDPEEFEKRLQLLRGHLRLKVNEDGVFYHQTDNGKPDDRANALAVMAGIAAPEQEEALARLFAETENASPYMEKTVLDALCEMNRTDEALARIKKRYTPMMEDSYSTLWEHWDRSAGTINHAWTGGPLITMERYIAGVIPVNSVTYRVQPHPCSLRFIDCTVPTCRGSLRVQITAEGNRKQILIEHPAGIRVIPEVPDSWEKRLCPQS